MSRRRVNRMPPLLGPVSIGLLTLALLAAGVTWFQRNFERQVREVDTGWSAAARRNPFLAAERFLHRLGVDAETVPGDRLLRTLPPSDELIISTGLETLNSARRQRLRAWLTTGGRLVVEAVRELEPDATPRADDFLAGFGAVLRADPEPSVPSGEAIADLTFGDDPDPVRVGFAARWYLEDLHGESVGSASAADRPRLLQYRVGDGLLTVLSDSLFLTNADIGNHDHALALARLVRGSNKVWLLYDRSAPSLPALLWRHAPEAVIAALLLLAALLWALGPALGPRLPLPARARRDLTDHLEAASALLWRHGRGGLLLDASRRRVEQAWLRHHPVLHELDARERAEWIAGQVGIAPDALYDALYAREGRAADFVGRSRILQRLWITR